MKFFKYFLIFLVFMVVGTFIATLFSENKYQSQYELGCTCDKDSLFALLTDTSNVRNWVLNASGVLPRYEEVKAGEQTYSVIFMDDLKQRTTVDQIWMADIAQSSLTIKSSIPDRLDMMNTIQLVNTKSDSIIIQSRAELNVKGWLNRLLMGGASTQLLARQKAELSALVELCKKD